MCQLVLDSDDGLSASVAGPLKDILAAFDERVAIGAIRLDSVRPLMVLAEEAWPSRGLRRA